MRKLWVHFQQSNSNLNIDECGIQVYSSDESYQYRVYQNFVLHYIDQGEGFLEINNIKYHLKKGDGYIIQKSQDVYYYPNKNNPWTTYWVGLSGSELYDALSKTSLLVHPYTHFADNGQSQKIIKNICHTTLNQEYLLPSEFWYRSQIYLLLHQLTTEFSTYYPSDITPYTNSSEIAYNYITNNYMNDISIADIAQFMGVSRSYLYKLFKQNYGMSPQQFLINKRLSISASLLQTTRLSISQISYLVGFKDPLYFSKIFSKSYHVAPSIFRKQHSIEPLNIWDKNHA